MVTIVVVVVNMLIMVARTGQEKLTFKLDFPGNL